MHHTRPVHHRQGVATLYPYPSPPPYRYIGFLLAFSHSGTAQNIPAHLCKVRGGVKLLDTWEPRTVCQHLGAYQTSENETPKNRGFGGHQDQDTTEATAFLPMARRGKSVAMRGKSVARREETVARRGKGVARRGKSVARPRKSVARRGQGVARPGTVLATPCQGSGKRGKARGRQLHPGKCTDGWQTVRGSHNFGSLGHGVRRERRREGEEELRRGRAE